MVATLTKNSSGTSWATGNIRTYDVWGSVRTGNPTGGPAGRYCANLGHVQDDESGLVYMRARYYEPTSGRFISEDPAGDGDNWYVYASNSPLTKIDKQGRNSEALVWGLVSTLLFIVGLILAQLDFDLEGAISRLVKHIAQLKAIAGIENITSKFGWGVEAELAKQEQELAKQSSRLRATRIAKGGAIAGAIISRLLMFKSLLIDTWNIDAPGGLEFIFGGG